MGLSGSSAERESFRRRVDQALLVLYATVAESVGWATAALLDEDVPLAERLISNDRDIDERCRDVSATVKERLSSGRLDPDELEDLIAILQMVPELERSADLAEHVAQRARDGLGALISPRARGLIQKMCDAGIRMWQLSARAYAERSRDITFELNEIDDEMDNLSAGLVAEGAMPGVAPATAAELALVARFYERIGDHAVNLARRSAEMSAPRRLLPFRALRRKRADEDLATTGPSAPARSGGLLGRVRRLRIVPKDVGFFELFCEAASLARLCSAELLETVADLTDIEDHYQHIRAMERTGDEITVEVLRRLDATFVTPYDREDIHALAEELDDVLDDMFAAVALIHQVPVHSSLPEVKQQAEILATMGAELELLMGCLRTKEGARHRLERIEALEREGDAVRRRSVGRLFSGEFEPLEVLKWKDIVQAMEDAMNKIEDVADVVESILVKES